MLNVKVSERIFRKFLFQLSIDVSIDKERGLEDVIEREKVIFDFGGDGLEVVFKLEEFSDFFCLVEEIKNYMKENNSLLLLSKDVQQESIDLKIKLMDKGEKKFDGNEKGERKKEKKEKIEKKIDYFKRNEDIQKVKDER